MKLKLSILKNHGGGLSFIFLLMLLSCILEVFMPFLIGQSINGLLEGSYRPLIILTSFMLANLFFSSFRTFFDSRVYAKIYKEIAFEIMAKDSNKKRSVSKTSAKMTLITECLEWIEDYFPEILETAVSLIGTLIILYFIDTQVFWMCLLVFGLLLIVYKLQGRRIYKVNQFYNNELEKQVDVIASRSKPRFKSHLNRTMRWNVRLSDIETVNFSLLWIGLSALLPCAIIIVTKNQAYSFGDIVSVVLYVYEYILLIIGLPESIGDLIRLREITTRLKESK